jgi:hypothetical protein
VEVADNDLLYSGLAVPILSTQSQLKGTKIVNLGPSSWRQWTRVWTAKRIEAGCDTAGSWAPYAHGQ